MGVLLLLMAALESVVADVRDCSKRIDVRFLPLPHLCRQLTSAPSRVLEVPLLAAYAAFPQRRQFAVLWQEEVVALPAQALLERLARFTGLSLPASAPRACNPPAPRARSGRNRTAAAAGGGRASAPRKEVEALGANRTALLAQLKRVISPTFELLESALRETFEDATALAVLRRLQTDWASVPVEE